MTIRTLKLVSAFFIAVLLLVPCVSANVYGKNNIGSELENITALHETVISDHRSGTRKKGGEAVLRVLFVKCSNVTMDLGGRDRTFRIEKGSDTDRVIDHSIIRFKQGIEEMTDHSVRIMPYCAWIDDAMTLPSSGFGYDDVSRYSSKRIPVSDFDSVFFFSGRQVGYGTTAKNLLLSEYGESCVYPLDVSAEIKKINAGTPMTEERKEPWTCGFMTHEFIHQIDVPAKLITGDERFPTCHQYQVDGKAGLEYLRQTNEGGDIYLTNPENGLKWKYVPGKYPDFIGDYYEAFFRGEIIDTKDGNRKKGMFPSLWRMLVSDMDLGTCTIRNTTTNRYLYASESFDRAGASALLTVSHPDLTKKNVQWDIVYDIKEADTGCFRLIPKLDETELMRAEKSPVYDTAALYRNEWGIEPTENKNFSFALSEKRGGCRIMTTLDVLDGCVLCDTDGTVEFNKTDKNDTWEIVKLSE
ncbi:MAG: hypothetical protein II936_08735 [Oscillospiraceae bacterium]|nr:hypothetical protein [Oscillospiraceae bacterium]